MMGAEDQGLSKSLQGSGKGVLVSTLPPDFLSHSGEITESDSIYSGVT